ncbi:MAG: class I SAM-dependent methyltransferase [Planctomycetes bacterium]|nr:class I SAM-dependent methyltransferase [Planctomycetota bacterium]
MIRPILFPFESLVYGPPYAWLQYLIRSPEPLDPADTWDRVSFDLPPAADWVRNHWPLRPLRPALLAAKMKQDHVLGIAAHYNVSNDFFELFLDKKYMFYTCADFVRGDETLEEAQQAKADFILRQIDPQPGQRILELGCGWGSMLRRIYEQTSDKENLYGLTLSQEQVAYNEAHHGFQVQFDDFITRDYPEAEFDAIYSIGAWEHVRPKEIEPLLSKLYRALKPGGKLVKHFFCRVPVALFATAVCSQIYFPGSIGSSYRFHCKAFERAGFRIVHRSIHDYRPTLRAWYDNLAREKDRALELVDVPTFNRYLTFFPASWRYFDDGFGMVTRWTLTKPA